MTRLVLALALGILGATSPAPARAHDDDVIRFTVDVAENFDEKFVPTPVNPGDTAPVRGAWFLTEGSIFPAGTIEGDGSTFDPTEHEAIGTWHCRGTHLIGLAEILAGQTPWVTTNQIYLLPDDKKMLTTDGLEGSEPVVRSVTGGTGPFRGYVGEQHQRFLGLNKKNGVNLRVTFILRRAANR
jgi:hypothetical protein